MATPVKESFRYLAISQQDRDWDLYVPGVGFALNEMPGPINPAHPAPYYYRHEEGRVLPEYQLVYITQGEGTFESEACPKQVITAGNLFVLFPGVWHRYAPNPLAGWDEYWVSVNGDYFDRVIKRSPLSAQSPVLTTGLDETIFHGYRRIWDRVHCEPPGLQQLIAANSLEILGAALAAVRARRMRRTPSGLVDQACLILRGRYDEAVDMEELAASLHISYDRFRHLFKEQTGLSPYQYHLQARILRAQEMLRSTQLSIREISTSLNFADPYHFSKMFKEKTGMSPTRWRGEAGRRKPS